MQAVMHIKPLYFYTKKMVTGQGVGFVQGNRANRVKLLPCRRKQMPCLGKFALWNALSFLVFFLQLKCFE